MWQLWWFLLLVLSRVSQVRSATCAAQWNNNWSCDTVLKSGAFDSAATNQALCGTFCDQQVVQKGPGCCQFGSSCTFYYPSSFPSSGGGRLTRNCNCDVANCVSYPNTDCTCGACTAGLSGTTCQTVVPCPNNSSRVANTCVCNTGYYSLSGPITWSSPSWAGNCNVRNCPINSTGPLGGPCTCNSGYNGTISWNNSTSNWSGSCSVVPCPANATGAPTCLCLSGYSGVLSWNSSRRWNGTCSLVACPPDASGSPSCVCNRGYSGVLAWNNTTRSWNGNCTVSLCPPNSSGVAGSCVCSSGFRGTISWNFTQGGSYDGSCTAVPCPPNSSAGSNGTCVCDRGYQGNISWNGSTQNYTGACQVVPCPLYSSGSVANCSCDAGFAGSPLWDSATQRFNGNCTDIDECAAAGQCAQFCVNNPGSYNCASLPCPENSSNSSDSRCVCSVGYYGLIQWNATLLNYTGNCTLCGNGGVNYSCPLYYEYSGSLSVPCPLHSSGVAGSGLCTCDSGYRGTIAWNETFIGDCQEVPCPASSQPGGAAGSCECSAGFAGTLQWNSLSQNYSGVCTEVPCPASSQPGGAAGSCECSVGFSGTFQWNSSAQNYSGVCTEVACPASSQPGGAAGSCNCSVGFAGTLEWNSLSQNYSGVCTEVACPTSSQLSSVGAQGTCVCLAGFNGTIRWVSGDQNYSGLCAEVRCPLHSTRVLGTTGDAYSCNCDENFAGNITWDSLSQSFQGVCQSLCDVNCQNCTNAMCVACVAGYHLNQTTHQCLMSCSLELNNSQSCMGVLPGQWCLPRCDSLGGAYPASYTPLYCAGGNFTQTTYCIASSSCATHVCPASSYCVLSAAGPTCACLGATLGDGITCQNLSFARFDLELSLLLADSSSVAPDAISLEQLQTELVIAVTTTLQISTSRMQNVIVTVGANVTRVSFVLVETLAMGGDSSQPPSPSLPGDSKSLNQLVQLLNSTLAQAALSPSNFTVFNRVLQFKFSVFSKVADALLKRPLSDVLGIILGVLSALLLFYVLHRYLWPSSAPVRIALILIRIVSYISKIQMCLFLLDNSFTRYYRASAIVLGGSSFLNLFYAASAFKQEILVKEFAVWLSNNLTLFVVGIVLSCMNPTSALVLKCHLFGLSLFDAPMSHATTQRLELGSILATLICEVPFLFIQVSFLRTHSELNTFTVTLSLVFTGVVTLANSMRTIYRVYRANALLKGGSSNNLELRKMSPNNNDDNNHNDTNDLADAASRSSQSKLHHEAPRNPQADAQEQRS